MKIYSIIVDNCRYDEFDGFIVIANNPNEVLELVNKMINDQTNTESFNNKKNIKVLGTYSGKLKKPFIALSSYNAG